MKYIDFLWEFVKMFVLAFIATAIVTLLWNHFIKNNGLKVDWETSFRMAFVFGLVIPLSQIKKK
jgi:hypothetical protein